MNFRRRLNSLVVVDSAVADYQALISSVAAEAEVILLKANQDGIEQISQALAAAETVTQLHILSHGQAGSLQLGATRLSWQNLGQYAEKMRSWASSLCEAEIFLYGCEVAAGKVGQWFVRQLKSLTGAEIAASADLTGNAALGGNWNLEFTTGRIRSPLAFSAPAMAAYPHVLATLVTDTFRESDVRDKSWITGIGEPAPGQAPSLEPFLTARDTTTKPTGGIAGNPGIRLDAPGDGALRLTNNQPDQAAFVLYNSPIPSNRGLTVTFELFAYGGTDPSPEQRADGISFFLLDGTVSPSRAGAFGGSLGYAQKIGIAPGLEGGYLGIGFDEFGNFSSANDAPGTPDVRNGGSPAGRTPDSIAIRGSVGSGYAFLGGTGSLPFGIDNPLASPTDRTPARREVKIDLTPTGFLTVQIDGNNDGDFLDPGESNPNLTNVDIAALTGTLTPSTLKFGFAAGTGDFNNIHEIRNLVVSTLNNPPETLDFGAVVIPGSTSILPGFSATDPDVADGDFVEFFQILTLPTADQGTLFVGNPAVGGTPVVAGSSITPTDIQNIYFQAAPGFAGSTFTYTALDSRGEADLTPATVTLTASTTPPPPNGNLPPDTNPTSLTVPQNTAAVVPNMGGTDPDGTVTSFTILTLPAADEGRLFLGDPAAGGVPITVGQILTPAQITQVYFQSSTTFQGSSFTYAATDDLGATDPTPAEVRLNLGTIVEPVFCPPGRNFRGGNRGRRIRGTPGTDTLRGGRGNDRIIGLDCPDLLDGGRGNDRLVGGAARDRLLGRQGRDVARGNAGNDVINLGLGRDAGFGGKGDDVVNGRRGNDRLFGKPGNDQLLGGRGNDEIRGGANRDFLDGQQGNDRLRGENGVDDMNGGLGRDRIRGGRLNDRGYGRRGDDVMWGGPGRDVLFGNRGKDRISGNQGPDRLVGGLGDDVITGGPGSDRIRPGAGADRILYRSARHGTDTIIGFNPTVDRIDLRRAFRGSEYGSSDKFGAYVRLRDGADGAILRVDANGDAAGGFVRLAILEGLQAASLSATNFLV